MASEGHETHPTEQHGSKAKNDHREARADYRQPHQYPEWGHSTDWDQHWDQHGYASGYSTFQTPNGPPQYHWTAQQQRGPLRPLYGAPPSHPPAPGFESPDLLRARARSGIT